MDSFDIEKNSIFIGNVDKLKEWMSNGGDHEKTIERVRLLLKNYLELDNVSFLFGSGSSIHLGAVAIRNFPVEIEDHIKAKSSDEYGLFIEIVKTYDQSLKLSLFLLCIA